MGEHRKVSGRGLAAHLGRVVESHQAARTAMAEVVAEAIRSTRQERGTSGGQPDGPDGSAAGEPATDARGHDMPPVPQGDR